MTTKSELKPVVLQGGYQIRPWLCSDYDGDPDAVVFYDIYRRNGRKPLAEDLLSLEDAVDWCQSHMVEAAFNNMLRKRRA